MLFKNILVPTDFSRNSLDAYLFALNFAKINSAKLHVLHILEPSTQSLQKDNEEKKKFERERVFSAEEELERFLRSFSGIDADICSAVIPGKPHEEIIKYAKNQGVDLIIMAMHGKTNLYHLIAGNVAKKVLKYSETPVVCIKTNILSISEETLVQQGNLAENWVG